MTPYFAPEGGGLEQYAYQILTRLAAKHDVRALSFTRAGHGHSLHGGIDVRRRVPAFCIGNTPIDPAFPRLVREAIAESGADVVVAHTPVPFAAEAASRAAARAGVPFVLTYHAGRLHGSSLGLELAAAALRHTVQDSMVRRSDALVAVGPFVRDHALASRRDEVAVIPPGVDAKRFHPVRKAPRKEILFVAPLSRSYRWKGVDVLWNAFGQVRRHHPDATLRLVGNGDRLEEFQARSRKTPGVIVHGRAADDQLAHLYQQATVLALPSTSEAESFGMVLAEANACARPVVASRIGGIPDHIRDGQNGLLCRPGDATDLATQLVTLLDDPASARAMGRRGRRNILVNHDWDRLAEATERVLEDAQVRK